jgi:protein-tyrosine phosphatase
MAARQRSGRIAVMSLRVTVVCTGNICRSPIGEVLLRAVVERAGLTHAITVDSAGTGAWHLGDPMHRRSAATLRAHGLDGSAHRAQQITASWFERDDAPDLVLAMDSGHAADLRRMSPAASIALYRAFDPAFATRTQDDVELDVPDPYYGDLPDYEVVYAMLDAATPGVLAHLRTLL